MDVVQGLVNLDLPQLSKIDGGRIAVCFQDQLNRVVRDIEDRPADDRDREITIKLTIRPNAGLNDGLLDGAKMKAQVTSKVPTYRSKSYDFGVRNGNLRFQPMSPTDHNATPLPGIGIEEED